METIVRQTCWTKIVSTLDKILTFDKIQELFDIWNHINNEANFSFSPFVAIFLLIFDAVFSLKNLIMLIFLVY